MVAINDKKLYLCNVNAAISMRFLLVKNKF